MAAITRSSADEVVTLQGEMHLRGQKTVVPFNGLPIQLVLGPKDGSHKKLHLYADHPLNPHPEQASQRLILFDPECYFCGISGQVALEPGQRLVLGKAESGQGILLDFPKTVSNRHLLLDNSGDALVFKDLHSEFGTYVSRLEVAEQGERLIQWRRAKLQRIRDIFGGPIQLLPRLEAMATLKQVNSILEDEVYRPRDSRGKPGAVLKLPDELTPIIVGDLHAQLDNLLKILSENSFLESLEAGQACLLIIGDAVHSEIDGEMENMISSMLMMDLIFKLKIRFPDRVFYIRGNHDAFLPNVSKGGISQGLIWEKQLQEVRGIAYQREMALYYRQLPYVVLARDFIACHAAPPKSKVCLDDLINATQNPGLIEQLTCNRVKRPNYPAGYNRGDVRRLRKGLDLPADTPFIVAHNPLADGKTLWLNVEGIENHHIVYSAMTDQLSLFTRIEGHLESLCYPTEHLLSYINTLSDAPKEMLEESQKNDDG
jgi:hypothetical protein